VLSGILALLERPRVPVTGGQRWAIAIKKKFNYQINYQIIYNGSASDGFLIILHEFM